MIHRLHHHYHRVKHHLHNAFIPHEGNDHRPHALRKRALTAYAIVIIAAKLVVSGVLLVYPGPISTSNLTPRNIVDTTNLARTNNGVKSLRDNPALAQAATLKAQDMLTKGYFAHISPQKVTPWYWFKRAGYNYSSAGENLAIDFTTAEDVTEAWLQSPGHRKNLLNPKYVDIGVAVASGSMKGTPATVVVQFFGIPVQVVQKKTTVKRVTPPPPPPSTKPSSVAKAAPLPPKPVLGESTDIPLPAQPKITSPESSVVLATAQPWIGGESQPDLTVVLLADGQSVGTTTSDERGYFRLQPAERLAEGRHVLTAHVVNERGSSPASAGVTVTVDTVPPSSALGTTLILPSLVSVGGYTVVGSIAGQDVTTANVTVGNVAKSVVTTNGRFVVELPSDFGSGADDVDLQLKDEVGNTSQVAVGSLSFFNVEVVAPHDGGPAVVIPKIVFYSRTFFMTFWLFIFLALAINVVIKIRVQHRATILYSLLLLYGLAVLLIV